MSKPIPDPVEMSALYTRIAENTQRLIDQYLARGVAGQVPALRDDLGVARAFFESAQHWFDDPARLTALQLQWGQEWWSLWQQTAQQFMGQAAAPVIEPAVGDRRFRDPEWTANPAYAHIKQAYLLTARQWQSALGSVAGVDAVTAKKVAFYTRQAIDAMAPTNFAMTNPEVMRATIDSGGQNLVQGLDNLLADLVQGGGQQLRIQMTDTSAFELGRNIATTPGQVVFQNELMQLLQYAPSTPKVNSTPLLIIPPWINKYYILDLRENNSFVRWAVAQGHTVFVISWVNPDARLAAKQFEDYLTEGAVAALDVIQAITGQAQANVIGYCLGGTLLAALLAWLAAREDSRVRSATFFVSLIDFTQPGELDVFIDEQQVAALEQKMADRGYLEGTEMATTFNLLRANDLIWSFVVSNYLLGKQPPPFDLLYWNGDSTRMPAAMHTYYLRNMYLNNRLREPDALTLAGTPIDVRKIKTPAYFISTMEDHIAPWASTYRGAQLFSGPTRFVLGGSGHIAGIINPPAANKYGYWANAELPADAGDWLNVATQHPGSWWTDWAEWVKPYSGRQRAAREPGTDDYPAIEPAPGGYVQRRAQENS